MHTAHVDVGAYIYHNTRNADQLWFAFSISPHKTDKIYEDDKHRMAVGEILTQDRAPNVPCVMSDFEIRTGIHRTADLLHAIKAEYPQHNFVLAMGADSFANLDTWYEYEDLIAHTPIVIAPRPGEIEKALNSDLAKSLSSIKLSPEDDIFKAKKGWLFLEEGPQLNISSTDIRKNLKAGVTKFDDGFQPAADYIMKHKLYDFGVNQLKNDASVPDEHLMLD